MSQKWTSYVAPKPQSGAQKRKTAVFRVNTMRVEYELSIVYILSWLKRQLSLDFNFGLFIIITIGFSSYDVCSLCADLPLKTTHSLKRSTVFAFVHFVVIFRVTASFDATTKWRWILEVFPVERCGVHAAVFVSLLPQCRRRCGSNPLSCRQPRWWGENIAPSQPVCLAYRSHPSPGRCVQ